MPNAFESGTRKVIPAVLVYLRKGDEFLMIHRGAQSAELSRGRPADYHSGKWNGLGGKCEADESPLETTQREVREESGLEIPLERFVPAGVLQFPNFKAHKNEDWMAFVFTADVSSLSLDSLLRETAEGVLHWIPKDDLLQLNLWAGDRVFLPWVLSGRSFIGTFWYEGQKLARHWMAELGSDQKR